MNINVKSTKVLKTGTNDHGEYTMVKVVTDDGVEYITFAKEANQISPGVTISISNLDESDKGKSFKKFEYVQGTAKAAPTPSESMTPDKWDEKDRIKNASIEGQAAMHDLTHLTIAGIKLEDCPELLRDAIQSKLEGFIGEVNPIPQAEKEEAVKTEAPPKELNEPANDRDLSTLKTLTDMQKAVHTDFGVQPADALKLLGGLKWADITDSPEECYLKIQANQVNK